MLPVFDQARTPAAPTPPPVKPAADQPGKGKAADPVGEIGSSVKVADPRRKVAKSFGRKS